MSTSRPDDALCREVRELLSPYLDRELTAVERLGVERHLEGCAGCRAELARLAEMSRVLREEGRAVPSPPPWEAVRSGVSAAGRRRGRLSPDRLLAASLALAALAGLLWVGLRSGPFDGSAPRPEERLLTAGLPGLEAFLAAHQAEEVDRAELEDRLGFRPELPEELPGGYRLVRSYVITDRCCRGSCLVYRRDGEVVSVVQHPASHPVSWRAERLEDCRIGGLRCRRGRGPGVELLQIDPQGRNLTVVAPAGVIEARELVRALAGR